MRRTVKGVLVILLFSALAAGQQTRTETKGAAPAKNEPISGRQLYVSYCAMCHGTDAKGGGPFSPQLKVWPPDLTQLAKKNNGTYPTMRVSEMVDGEFGKASAHGSREMPIWGPVFRSMAHGHNDNAQLRISSVVKYLESLQQK
ncbi:MAG: cytochrome c [Acidobacteriia bacterium]|nr:cytochrome c [Terriglobia bacterium]